MLAVGSHDNDIYIYRVNGTNYDFHGKLRAHKSFITNMDWSRDGRYIQSNCGAYEYLFFDVQNVTNNKNVFAQRYNPLTNNINTAYQIGFFPNFVYKVQF
jgi:WD40 repeat protein